MLGRALQAGCAVHLLSSDGERLARAASWHPGPAQLAALNEHLFAEQTTAVGHPRTVLQTRKPVLIARREPDHEPDHAGPIAGHATIFCRSQPTTACSALFLSFETNTPKRSPRRLRGLRRHADRTRNRTRRQQRRGPPHLPE
jgi:hypothetical protein